MTFECIIISFLTYFIQILNMCRCHINAYLKFIYSKSYLNSVLSDVQQLSYY